MEKWNQIIEIIDTKLMAGSIGESEGCSLTNNTIISTETVSVPPLESETISVIK